MTEIEQLRQDIATLEAAEGVFRRKYGQDYKHYNTELVRIRKRLAKLEAEENRKGSKMKWTYSGEGEWSMPSAYHDDGLSFQWRIGVCEDGTFCVSGSDPELTRCRETLPTLAEAKIFCESIEQQIREPGSRCNLELPLDAAAAQARIAELEAELAKKPVVDPEPTQWGGKVDGKWVLDGFGKPLRFYSREAAKYVFSDAVEIVPYTGEQS